MKKNKVISLILVTIISIVLIFMISKVLFDTSGQINQGNFRVNDLVLNSSLDVEEINTEETFNGFESMELNLSQRNNISLLVANQTEINEIYMDNISISSPLTSGNVVFYQNGAKDDKIDIYQERVTIYPEEKSDQILISLNIDNEEFLKGAKIPDGTELLTFDGTMLKLLDIDVKNLEMKVKFNLNIVDNFGKLNVCKFDFTIPGEDLKSNGISVKRQNLGNYHFIIEDSVIKKWLNKL